MPERIAAAGIDVEALRFLPRAEFEYDANWKICAENFLECYHCAVAHPGFSAVMDVSPDAYLLETNHAHDPARAPETRAAGRYDPSGEIERGQFHLLFPGTVVNVMPGRPNFSIGPIIPLGPERTYRFLDYFVAADADDAWVEEMLAFDAQVGAEDRVLVERVQAGVRSGLLDEGRLMPRVRAARRALPSSRGRRARLSSPLRRGADGRRTRVASLVRHNVFRPTTVRTVSSGDAPSGARLGRPPLAFVE